jgi:hypothetical protein
MRLLGGTAAVACALGLLAGTAGGQAPGANNNLPPAAMPGQVIGTPLNLNPVGTPVNKAVPSRADLKKLESPLSRPYDPGNPLGVFKGTNLDPKMVVAPVAAMHDLQSPNLLDKLYQKINTSVASFFSPSPAPRPTYTPGISRRNRERAENRMWRRD